MNICCIEDQVPTQEIIETIISDQINNASIFMFSDTLEAQNFIKNNSVDLIISDLDIHGTKELELISLSSSKNIPTIVFSAHDDPGFVNAVFDAGATAFISKFKSLDIFRNAVKNWKNLCSALGTHIPLHNTKEFDQIQLNDRDKSIIRLLIKGESRERIADKLHLSQHSVNSYLRNMCRKHNCKKEELIYRFLIWDSL